MEHVCKRISDIGELARLIAIEDSAFMVSKKEIPAINFERKSCPGVIHPFRGSQVSEPN